MGGKLTERKQFFINSYSKTKTGSTKIELINLFMALEKYEEMFHKDAAEFTKEEIILFLHSLDSFSLDTLRRKVYGLARYVDWCNDLLESKTENSYNEISYSDLISCVKSKTIQREILIRDIETHCINACDKFIFLAIYEGFTLHEILSLTKDKVSKETLIVKDENETVRTKYMSEKLSYYCKETLEECEYIKNCGLIDGNGEIGHLLEKNNYLIRFAPSLVKISGDSVEQKEIRITKRLRNCLTINNPLYSYTRMFNSGFTNQIDSIMNKYGIDISNFIKGMPQIPEFQELLIQYNREHWEMFQIKSLYRKYMGVIGV